MTFLRKGNVYALPILHYTMECAAVTKRLFDQIEPDCVAVELPEMLEESFLRGASRLPDIGVVSVGNPPLYYMVEPCDAAFEGLRSALERGIAAYCIDLAVEEYPLHQERLPDPYAIVHIGLEKYYAAYLKSIEKVAKGPLDEKRELHMARRLKELSLRHERILFIGGFFHVHTILEYLERDHFPAIESSEYHSVSLITCTEESARDVMAECGWISAAYEEWRTHYSEAGLLDRQRLLFHLYKTAGTFYEESTGHRFEGYHLRNVMKFVRNYALLFRQLMPDLYQVLSAAKGCVDHNYAYETWQLATHYPFLKNIDNLPEKTLSIEEVWGNSKLLRFHLKQKSRKGFDLQRKLKNRLEGDFHPPSPFSICSYPPEDVVIERFGDYLKKKGNILQSEEGGRTVPFMTSLEDGIDMRETIRRWYEKKLYVKVKGRPPGSAASVVMIFHEEEGEEKYPWNTTWIGEHNQESDMAFYATAASQNIVGPGISRCEYGGFMMTAPPRRLNDVWGDPDYYECHNKAEVLLMAAIDYAVKPVIIYVAEKPPRSKLKSFASRFGKKIVYIPLGQFSSVILNKIRIFHVLDGHDKREIAGEYIF